ncbi:MAG: class I SAM-dependent methyltransferase [Alphaproteobacteria bacterium]|nr:class I SAM-dependent methyltransferase [Alphaproteobacteria bacterium]MBU0796828.1 class I SAM-dependent methyltransferase [Alphaproteobacteria bacterium]MBU0885814.1 class I SAM-dependent methyltransferase [Alphaproteobacteria bacterium]MBU1812109.1 class I SAM-dependent methyltransferase [Alphaproteobacteria bacterium]MBU2090943.1 class I SAM-dependent methyltransferase [Alphaproteobacteria bacterium]
MTEAEAGHASFIVGDARDMHQFNQGAFDIAHSNSVIEHVGLWESMQAMADEVRRVAPAYFIQTPSFWFPLEIHTRFPFFQFLPEPFRLWLLMNRDLGYMKQAADIGEATRLLQETFLLNKSQIQHLFPDASIHTERALGLPKSYIAIKR